LLGALSLSVQQTLLVAAAAAVAEVLLQREAGIRPGAWRFRSSCSAARLRRRPSWCAACGRWWPA